MRSAAGRTGLALTGRTAGRGRQRNRRGAREERGPARMSLSFAAARRGGRSRRLDARPIGGRRTAARQRSLAARSPWGRARAAMMHTSTLKVRVRARRWNGRLAADLGFNPPSLADTAGHPTGGAPGADLVSLAPKASSRSHRPAPRPWREGLEPASASSGSRGRPEPVTCLSGHSRDAGQGGREYAWIAPRPIAPPCPLERRASGLEAEHLRRKLAGKS